MLTSKNGYLQFLQEITEGKKLRKKDKGRQTGMSLGLCVVVFQNRTTVQEMNYFLGNHMQKLCMEGTKFYVLTTNLQILASCSGE